MTRNKELETLYTVWAIEHLNVVNEMIDTLSDSSNIHMSEAAGALCEVRTKWLEDSAYARAAVLIMQGRDHDFVEKHGEKE